MKTEIEAYIQRVTKAGIKDKAIIENTHKTVVEFIEILKQGNVNLRKSANSEISVEEMIFVNNNAFNLIQDLNQITQSCKSFLAMFKDLSDDGNIDKYFQALKITNDKQYYFFCNFDSDCCIYYSDCSIYYSDSCIYYSDCSIY